MIIPNIWENKNVPNHQPVMKTSCGLSMGHGFRSHDTYDTVVTRLGNPLFNASYSAMIPMIFEGQPDGIHIWILRMLAKSSE